MDFNPELDYKADKRTVRAKAKRMGYVPHVINPDEVRVIGGPPKERTKEERELFDKIIESMREAGRQAKGEVRPSGPQPSNSTIERLPVL